MFPRLLVLLAITAFRPISSVSGDMDCTNCPSSNQISYGVGDGDITVTSVTGTGFAANSITTFEDIVLIRDKVDAVGLFFTQSSTVGQKACFTINIDYPVQPDEVHVCGVSLYTKFVDEITFSCGGASDTQNPNLPTGFAYVEMNLPAAGVEPGFSSCSVCINATTKEFMVIGFDINACVICDYSAWSPYEDCQEGDCGQTTVTSTRECGCDGNPYECLPGSTSQTKDIDCGCCPIDCVQGPWGTWDDCTAGCGEDGTRSRQRTTITQPNSCGAACGPEDDTEVCSGEDRVDCVQSPWGDWDDCTAGCGEDGTRSRSRTTVTQPNSCGTPCGPEDDTEGCSGEDRVDCVQGPWGDWGDCTAGCGEDGSRSRSRTTVTQPNSCGTPCGPEDDTEVCTGEARVDCVQDPWGDWGDCTGGCGEDGTRSRHRTTVTQPNSCGTACGPEDDIEECSGEARVDCVLGSWGTWSDCSNSCGEGTQTRSRDVITTNNVCGTPCGDTQETKDCTEDCVCPEDKRVTLNYNNQGEIDEMQFEGKVDPADVVFSQDPLKALEGSGESVIMSKNDAGEDTLVIYFSPKVQVFEVSLEYKINAQVKLDLYGSSDNLLYNGVLVTSPNGPSYSDWHTAVWTPESEAETVRKAVISFGDWAPTDEVKVRNLKFVVCPPEREDCVCRVRGDPVVENCMGDLLFLDSSSVGQQLAVGSADSDCPGISIYINNVMEGQALVPESVIIQIGGSQYVLDINGNVTPALPASPSSSVSTMDGMTTVAFDCGLSVSFKKTENFSIVNVNIPGDLQLSATGFCF